MTAPRSLLLTDFIAMLKRELAAAARARQGDETAFLLKTATVEVEVTTELDASTTGGCKFYVVALEGGASRKRKMTHKLSLELVPDSALLLGSHLTQSRLDA